MFGKRMVVLSTVNEATGGDTAAPALTFNHVVCVDTLLPAELVAVRFRLQLPTPNEDVTGGVAELNWNHVLLPGVRFFAPHDHDVGVLVEVSVNRTAVGAVPVVTLVVKEETGVTAPTPQVFVWTISSRGTLPSSCSVI